MAQGTNFIAAMTLRLENEAYEEGIQALMADARSELDKTESNLSSLKSKLASLGKTDAKLSIDLDNVEAAEANIRKAQSWWEELGEGSPLAANAEEAQETLTQMERQVRRAASAQDVLERESLEAGEAAADAGRKGAQSNRNARAAALSLTQGLSDLSYGFGAISNNAQQFAEQLGHAQAQGQSMGGAIKAVFSSMLSPAVGVPALIAATTTVAMNWEEIQGVIQGAKVQMGYLNEEQRVYNDALAKGRKSAEELFLDNLDVSQMRQAREELAEERQAAREEINEIQRAAGRGDWVASAPGGRGAGTGYTDAQKERLSELRGFLEEHASLYEELSRRTQEATAKTKTLSGIAKALPGYAEATKKETEGMGRAASSAAQEFAKLKANLLPDGAEKRRLEAQLLFEERRAQINELTDLSKEKRQELNKLAMKALASDMGGDTGANRSEKEEQVSYADELQSTLTKLQYEGVEERVRLLNQEYERKIDALDTSGEKYAEYAASLEKERARKVQTMRLESARKIGKQAREIQKRQASIRKRQLQSNLSEIKSTLSEEVQSIQEGFSFRSALAQASAGGQPGNPAEGVLAILSGGAGAITAQFAKRRAALTREYQKERQLINAQRKAARKRQEEYGVGSQGWMDAQNQIIALKGKQLRQHKLFEEQKTAVTREESQARKRLAVRSAQQTLSEASSASRSLFNSWRSHREAELKAQGVSEEQRSKILKEESKRRFKIVKALMVARATGDTLSAGVAAYRNGIQIGGPLGMALGAAQMATALGTGFAQVKKIQGLKPGGTASSGGAKGGGKSIGGSFSQLNESIAAERREQNPMSKLKKLPDIDKTAKRVVKTEMRLKAGSSKEFSEAAEEMKSSAREMTNAAYTIRDADMSPRISRRDAGAIVEEGESSNAQLNS